jgi:hypothetical protein
MGVTDHIALIGDLSSDHTALQVAHGPIGSDPDSVQELLNFVKPLSQSLREIYLKIHADDIFCEEESEFDPVSKLGPEIFETLKGLHTCAIHAWISNRGGGLGSTPEKAVLYRRLPSNSSPGNNNIKEI